MCQAAQWELTRLQFTAVSCLQLNEQASAGKAMYRSAPVPVRAVCTGIRHVLTVVTSSCVVSHEPSCHVCLQALFSTLGVLLPIGCSCRTRTLAAHKYFVPHICYPRKLLKAQQSMSLIIETMTYPSTSRCSCTCCTGSDPVIQQPIIAPMGGREVPV